MGALAVLDLLLVELVMAAQYRKAVVVVVTMVKMAAQALDLAELAQEH
jgi:hypothetical protein